MNSGKQIRQSRIFRSDGRTVIAALDHGIAGIQPLASLERPSELIRELGEVGVDAILTTPGIARNYADRLGLLGLILRVDGGPTASTQRWDKIKVILSVEDALRLGADAVAAMGIVGTDGECESLIGLERLAAQCDRWGMVLLAEMLPGGFGASEVGVKEIAVAARLGAEIGADIIKIRYSGNMENYKSVISSCYKPLVILGGAKQTQDQLLEQVQGALTAGASGVAVGRNIWQASTPREVARALVEVVHG
jgi:DhnA family fructose-bisphosphate aldolase class Ia